MHHFKRSKTRFAVIFLSLLLFASCEKGETPTGPQRTETTPKAARHAVHSAKLHAVMEDLEDGIAKTWPQEIETEYTEQTQRSRFRDATQTARKLAQTSDAIPAAIEDASLSDDDRAAFLTIVAMLKRQAEDLEAAAAAEDLPRMDKMLSMIKTTCHSCHNQFRDQAGPLSFGSSAR